MKALCFYDIEDIRYEEKQEPVITKETDVIIEVKFAGICGSDLSRYRKLGPLTPGNIFGHECAGKVVEIGNLVSEVQVGDDVAICPAMTCGECEACRSGYYAACDKLLVIGAKEPGGFAKYVKLPQENVLKLSSNITYKEAAFVEPSAVVLHGFFKTNIQPGKSVAVYGCGTIGLLAVQWAKIFGAEKVYAIDLDKKKLALASELGADVTVHPNDNESTYEQLMHVTNNIGVDLAIEAAGSAKTSAEIFGAPKKGGEVLFLGIPYSDINMSRFYFERIVRQELSVYGSWNAVSAPFPGREFDTTLHFLKEKKLLVEPLISHCVPLNMGPEMFHKITNGEESAVKVMFDLEKADQ